MHFKLIYIFIAIIAPCQALAILAKFTFATGVSWYYVLLPAIIGLFSYFVLFKGFCWVVNNFMNVQ